VRYSVYEVGAVDIKSFMEDPAYDRRQFGLGLGNFVPTVWNLMPFSFVVDYFSNVDGILKSLTMPTPTMVYHTRGTKVTRRASRVITSCYLKNGSPTSATSETSAFAGGSATRELFSFTRTLLSTTQISVPGLVLDIPNARQILNLVALGNSLRQSQHKLVNF